MTFRRISSSGSSPSATPSPDLFPVEETLQRKPTHRQVAPSISSLTGATSGRLEEAQCIQDQRDLGREAGVSQMASALPRDSLNRE